MPAGNDFCNNELKNPVIHLAGSDAERGVPAVGKLVYRTDTVGLEACTDTSPNGTEDGGGTWASLSIPAPTSPTSLTVVATEYTSGDPRSISSSEIYYVREGYFVRIVARITFDSGHAGGDIAIKVHVPFDTLEVSSPAGWRRRLMVGTYSYAYSTTVDDFGYVQIEEQPSDEYTDGTALRFLLPGTGDQVIDADGGLLQFEVGILLSALP